MDERTLSWGWEAAVVESLVISSLINQNHKMIEHELKTNNWGHRTTDYVSSFVSIIWDEVAMIGHHRNRSDTICRYADLIR